MRKEHRPRDNTQEAIRGVLIELSKDCINCGLINSLKSQMKSKLFIYFVCLIFAALLTVTSLFTESSVQSHVCVVPQGWNLSLRPPPPLSLPLIHSHTAGWRSTWQSSLQTLAEILIRTTEGNVLFWIITELPRIWQIVIPVLATRWQNPNLKTLLGWSCGFQKDPQDKDRKHVSGLLQPSTITMFQEPKWEMEK